MSSFLVGFVARPIGAMIAGARLYIRGLHVRLRRLCAARSAQPAAGGALTASVLGFIRAPIAGHLSDKIGRRRMDRIDAIFSGLYSFVYFTLLDTLSSTLIIPRDGTGSQRIVSTRLDADTPG
jgi:hypothetical protein